MSATLDVQIEGSHGFYMFTLLTRKARSWVRRNVDTDARGDSLPCDDGRYAREIAAGMIAAGMVVR